MHTPIVFGHLPTGEPIQLMTISRAGLSANIINFGAAVQDLRLRGYQQPLVLGFNNWPDYYQYGKYFGAIVGRVANRIRQAQANLNEEIHHFDANFLGKHTLHGGTNGTGVRLWNILEQGSDFVTLSVTLPAGDMGFPAHLAVEVRYSITQEPALVMDITAKSNAATWCNFASHNYFNLDGSDDILQHHLHIAAEQRVVVDYELIPTGELEALAETDFDFRIAKPIGLAGKTLDHSFCLATARQAVRPVATLSSPENGLQMQIETTEAGLQVYTGSQIAFPHIQRLDGKAYQAYAGIALEPQGWPDALNQAHFPSVQLAADDSYHQTSRFVFS